MYFHVDHVYSGYNRVTRCRRHANLGVCIRLHNGISAYAGFCLPHWLCGTTHGTRSKSNPTSPTLEQFYDTRLHKPLLGVNK